MESKTKKIKSEEFNLEDQIASMLVNVMDDSNDSEKEDSDIEETNISNHHTNCNLKFFNKNQYKIPFEPKIKVFEAKKIFKEEPQIDNLYSNNNSFAVPFFKDDNKINNLNPNSHMKEKKFYSNNYLDTINSFRKDFDMNYNDFTHFNNPMRLIPQQPNLFINKNQCNLNNPKEYFHHNNSDNNFKFQQKLDFFPDNFNAYQNLNSKSFKNFDNFDNFKNPNINFNTNNNFGAKESNYFKSQSAKNNNVFYTPINNSPKILSNNNLNNTNIRFYSNSNLGIYNNYPNNYSNVPQKSKFLNYINPHFHNNFNPSPIQNNINCESKQKIYYGSDKCLNTVSPFNQNKNNFSNKKFNKGSSTNVTLSQFSMMSNSNDQAAFNKSDEFQSIILNI
jgi:hypothetical protein